jgi:branched-chain amino acid transport system substrate-binding protein
MNMHGVSRFTIVGIIIAIIVVATAVGILLTTTQTTTTLTTAPTTSTTLTTTPTTTEQLPNEILIGVAIQLSGSLSVEGTASLFGMRIMEKWINDHGGVYLKGKHIPIKLIYYDCESKRDYAVQLTEKLITSDKVNIVIHPYASSFVMATAPVTEKYHMFSINFGGSSDTIHEQGFKYLVSTHTFASQYWKTPLELIKSADPNVKRVAIIYGDDEWGRSLAVAARKWVNEFGLEVVYDKAYPTTITDATPLLREIAPLKPDILFVGSHYADGYLIATQMRDLRVYIKWVVMQVAVSKPEFGANLGKWAVGFIGETTWEPEVKWEIVAKKEGKEYYGPTSDEFVKYYYEMGGKGRPSAYLGYGGVAVLLAAKVIEEAQSLDPDKLREAAGRLDFYWLKSRFKIDETGKQIGSINPVVQWQWHNGNLTYEIVYPYDFATAKVIPMPTWEEKEKWTQTAAISFTPLLNDAVINSNLVIGPMFMTSNLELISVVQFKIKNNFFIF